MPAEKGFERKIIGLRFVEGFKGKEHNTERKGKEKRRRKSP